jgi:hypothetical protein
MKQNTLLFRPIWAKTNVPIFSEFNTLKQRQDYLDADAANYWYIDDSLDSFAFCSNRSGQILIPKGTLPNKTFFTPHDLDIKKTPISSKLKVARLLLVFSFGSEFMNYPGNIYGNAHPNADFGDEPEVLYNEIYPILKAAFKDTDIHLILNALWPVDPYIYQEFGFVNFSRSRFLRALVPILKPNEKFIATDILNIVLFLDFGTYEILISNTPEVVFARFNTMWNFWMEGFGDYSDTSAEGPWHRDVPFSGLNSLFYEDLEIVKNAYPGFSRHRTILFYTDYDERAPEGHTGNNIRYNELANNMREYNAAFASAMVSELSPYGGELGGRVQLAIEGASFASRIISLITNHFK